MSDGIGLQLFEQNGVMMAEAPDGSVYRLSDVMRHNDPDTAYDDATGARVADLEQGTIDQRPPFSLRNFLWQQAARREGTDFADRTVGRRQGAPDRKISLLDFAGGGILDAVDLYRSRSAQGKEAFQDFGLDEGLTYGFGALEAIPGAIALTKPAKGAAKKIIERANQPGQMPTVYSNPIPGLVKNAGPSKTVKGYKLFTRGDDSNLYPLFVDADTQVPVNSWMRATFPEYRFKAPNGNFYVPSRGTAGRKGTGDMIPIPDQATREMLIKAGFLPQGSKAKSIRAVAARPGWHAGDNPSAMHIGPETKVAGQKYKIRGDNQVWAEVEMPADVDWQSIANSRASLKKDGTMNVKTAHITDELPLGGYYRYKTNPNMEGNWLISGDMRVNRVLDRDEVLDINKRAGVRDLPTQEELMRYLRSVKGILD